MGLILAAIAFVGLSAFFFIRQQVFVLSAFLHCLTFMFVGMFVTASVGEVLFNKDESEILLHRPILPKTLLRAKIGVLAEVSLWMAGALNVTDCVGVVATPFIAMMAQPNEPTVMFSCAVTWLDQVALTPVPMRPAARAKPAESPASFRMDTRFPPVMNSRC